MYTENLVGSNCLEAKCYDENCTGVLCDFK